ncbi:MAG: TonB family protein [Thermodesulfobacteriota bacterium]
MIRLPSQHKDRALPWMVVLSVLFHAAVIGAVVVCSSRWLISPKPPQVTGTPVKLAEVVSPVLLPETMPKEIKTASAEPVQGPVVQEAIPPAPARLKRDVVPRKSLEKPSKARIKPPTRKRAPKRVELAEEKPPKKPATDPVVEKEKQERLIEQRLAEIREKLDKGKAESRGAANGKATPATDQELAAWIDDVKRRVNSHWTIMGLSRGSDGKSTLIGLSLTESGQLQKAAIDKSSGDEVFDGSAMRAVYQAVPFPELSAEALERITAAGGVALMFTPKGIR